MTSSNVSHPDIFHSVNRIQAWTPLFVIVYFKEGAILSGAIVSFFYRLKDLFSASPNILIVFSIKKRDSFPSLSPTDWPCEVLIVPEWLNSRSIISHKSMKAGRTSDR